MASGRQNLNRGGGGGASGGSFPGRDGDGEHRNLRDHPNRRSRSFREAPYRCSLRPPNWPPIQRNRLPPPPTRARGSRSRQLSGRAGSAWSTSAATPPIGIYSVDVSTVSSVGVDADAASSTAAQINKYADGGS